MKKESKKGRGGGHGRENDESHHLAVCSSQTFTDYG
jgi:hypothetical protein